MFDKKTEWKINEAVALELASACTTYGPEYHSLHEGYAVLLEEVEEAESDINVIKEYLHTMWEEVKTNDDESAKADAIIMARYAVELAKEACQVAAVAKKIFGEKPHEERETTPAKR